MTTATEYPEGSVQSRRERSLDDWYRAINRIYLFRNLERDSAFMFMHLVEVCGALREHRTDRLGIEPAKNGTTTHILRLEDVIPKALAWWFALCAKVGVRSVEDVIWMKFPASCPYCYRCPHEPKACKPTQIGPDWEQLEQVAQENLKRRPRTVETIAEMLAEIYPAPEHLPQAIARLVEELGELGESVRVFDVAPHFFLNEAPDVFAWLVQCHRLIVGEERFAQDLDRRLAAAYPDACLFCTRDVCVCPSVLEKHHGRLAADGPNLAAAYRPRGGFLTRNEIVELIRTDPMTIDVGNSRIEVDAGELTAIVADVALLREWLLEHGAKADEVAKLQQTAEWLAHGHAIQETRLIEIRDAIDDLLDGVQDRGGSAFTEFTIGVVSNLVAALAMGHIPPSSGA